MDSMLLLMEMGRGTRIKRLIRSKGLCASALLIVLLGIVIAFRYKAAFSIPNFYAEDGTVFLQNILEKGIVGATFTAFNGYLVVGQYLIIDAAYMVYALFGLHFSSLPFLIAASSCLFLGLTASLPFILFRKELGWVMAFITSVLLAFTPLYGSDYAVIGTIGNLKFAFLFWAVLLIIYRNIYYREAKKAIIVDLILLLCVLTNGPVVALLPFALWPYRKYILKAVKTRTFRLPQARRPEVISLATLFIISAIYILVVYVKGIPVIPNYLTAPYIWDATDNIVYRTTLYGWLFPLSSLHNLLLVTPRLIIGPAIIVLLGILTFWVYRINHRGQKVFTFGLVAIAVSTLAFVMTRPGVSEYMLGYEKFPDQFFYAQTMIFVFITMWIIAPYVRTKRLQVVALGLATLYLVASVPFGSSYGLNRAFYSQRPDIYHAVAEACQKKADKVTVPIYPSEIWNLTVDRSVACK